MFDDQIDFHGFQQQEDEQKQMLDHLMDLWELAGITGKQESVLVVAERCGLLNEFKQCIEDNHGQHR